MSEVQRWSFPWKTEKCALKRAGYRVSRQGLTREASKPASWGQDTSRGCLEQPNLTHALWYQGSMGRNALYLCPISYKSET